MALQSVGGELPHFGGLRAPRTAPNDEIAFDDFLKEEEPHSQQAETPPEETPGERPAGFGGYSGLGIASSVWEEAGSGLPLSPSYRADTAYLNRLEFQFGDITVLDVPENGTVEVDITGMSKIIIAENILSGMSAFPGKAAYYEEKIRRFATMTLASLPQVQALLSTLGLDVITFSALVVQTDGGIRYLLGGFVDEKDGKNGKNGRPETQPLSRREIQSGQGETVLSLTNVEVTPFSADAAGFHTGVFLLVSFMEGLPHFASSRRRENQRENQKGNSKGHKKVEGTHPRWLKKQRQKE